MNALTLIINHYEMEDLYSIIRDCRFSYTHHIEKQRWMGWISDLYDRNENSRWCVIFGKDDLPILKSILTNASMGCTDNRDRIVRILLEWLK